MAASTAELAVVTVSARRRRVRWDVAVPAAIIAMIVLGATIGPLLVGDPNTQDLRNARRGLFTPQHLLGTDTYGRDILARALVGARVSLLVAVSSVLICLVVGGLLGLLAAYRGRWLDATIMRILDMMLAFPTLILALAIAAFLGPNVRNVVLAVSLTQIPHYARLSRANSISVCDREYVLSSRLQGASHRHTMSRHVLPNVIAPLVTYALLAFSLAILIEASLSFLGLGVQPPTPSWGGMIADGRADLADAPHLILVPGGFLFVTTMSINMLADALGSRPNMAGGNQ